MKVDNNAKVNGNKDSGTAGVCRRNLLTFKKAKGVRLPFPLAPRCKEKNRGRLILSIIKENGWWNTPDVGPTGFME